MTVRPGMTERTARRLAQLVFGLTTLLFIGGTVAAILLAARGAEAWRDIGPDIAFLALMYASFPLGGIVIARRQPRNAVAWVLLGVGLVWQTELPVGAYVAWAVAEPERVREAAIVAALEGPLWVWGLAPLGTFLLLLFPDGHLPSPRWRWWARLCLFTMIVATVGVVMWPGPLENFTPVTDNPLGSAVVRDLLGPLVFAPIIAIPITMVGAAGALIGRFRRSRGVERLQLKWLTAAAAIVAVVYLVTMLASLPYDWVGAAPTWVAILQNVSLGTFVLIPVAVGFAITRYRLYDIDRLINRALVYGAVSAVLIGVYVLGVVGAGGLLRAVTGSDQGNLAVAATTLGVAALFRPFRARVQRFIDRRFYRGKYDAALTVEAFSARLRQETDLHALSQELRDVVAATVQPSGVTLWIASGE